VLEVLRSTFYLYVLEKGGHIGGDGIGGGIGAPQRDAPGAHSTHGSESTLGGSGEIGESDEPCAARRLDGRRGESAAASVRWDVLAADGNSARFKKAARVEPGMLFPDMNAPGFAAGTARVYRYECAFCLPERPFCEQALYFPAFSDGVDLAVNGKSAGMLLGGSGQLDVSGLLRGGQNSLRVEIAGTLLPEKRDYASVFMQTPPAGMAREPILYNSI
jgi:hypothetical protein